MSSTKFSEESWTRNIWLDKHWLNAVTHPTSSSISGKLFFCLLMNFHIFFHKSTQYFSCLFCYLWFLQYASSPAFLPAYILFTLVNTTFVTVLLRCLSRPPPLWDIPVLSPVPQMLSSSSSLSRSQLGPWRHYPSQWPRPMARLHSSVSSMSDMIPTSPPLDVTLGHFPGCYKTAFVFFRNLGDGGGGVNVYWWNSQKAQLWLISRILSHWSCKFIHVQIHSQVFL